MILALRQNVANFYHTTSASSLFFKLDAAAAFLHSSTSHSVIHPTVYDFLVHNHNFSPQSASQIASVITRLPNPERSNSVLLFLKDTGFSIPQLEKTVKCWPKLLSSNLDKTIKPKIQIFHDIGIPPNETVDIISSCPLIFTRSVDRKLVPSLSVLKGLLGPNGLANFSKSGWYLFFNLDKVLIPNIELLKNCGVSMDQILRLMHTTPRFLLNRHQDMKKFVDKAVAMGVDRSSKAFVHAVKAISGLSDESWELKLKTLQGIGFSDDDIAKALQVAPMLFALSEERIKEAKEVLVSSEKYDVSCVVKHPVSLTYSIEKRHRPRLKVLEFLESKELIRRWPAFTSFYTMTDRKFYETYVAPFLDTIGDAYKPKISTKG